MTCINDQKGVVGTQRCENMDREEGKLKRCDQGLRGQRFSAVFSGTKKLRRKGTRNTSTLSWASWKTIHWISLHYGLAFIIHFDTDYLTIYLSNFLREVYYKRDRAFFLPPALRSRVYAGLTNFQKKTVYLFWKPLWNVSLLSLSWFSRLDSLHYFSLDNFCRLLG